MQADARSHPAVSGMGQNARTAWHKCPREGNTTTMDSCAVEQDARANILSPYGVSSSIGTLAFGAALHQ